MNTAFNPLAQVGPTPAVDLKVPTALWFSRLQLKPEGLWFSFLQNLLVGQSVCVGQIKGAESCPRCFGSAAAGIERAAEGYRFYAHWNLVAHEEENPFKARVEGQFRLNDTHIEFLSTLDLDKELLFAGVCARLALINTERLGAGLHQITGRGARLFQLDFPRTTPAQVFQIHPH